MAPGRRAGKQAPVKPGGSPPPVSRYRGVRADGSGRFAAEIRHPGMQRRIRLGTFAAAYDQAARLLQGERARPNFPLPPAPPAPPPIDPPPEAGAGEAPADPVPDAAVSTESVVADNFEEVASCLAAAGSA